MKDKGLAAWLVAAAVRALFSVMQIFPVHWNLQTACVLAKIWARLMPRHRQRAIANLANAFPGQYSVRELARLADRCLESWTMFAVEAICLPRLISPYNWTRYIRLVNFNEALRVFLDSRGVIMVTGHYGSFELIGHLLSALDFPTAAVMRPLDNFYLNKFIVDSRRMQGLELLDKRGATQEAESKIKEGVLLGFIGDQDAGRKGIFVDFFGQPASTYKSIGLLAMTTNSPIVVGFARRRGRRAEYDVGVQRIIYPKEWANQPDPLRWITQTYTSAIEAFIREAPEQYLWIHRRWKSQPRTRANKTASPGVGDLDAHSLATAAAQQ